MEDLKMSSSFLMHAWYYANTDMHALSCAYVCIRILVCVYSQSRIACWFAMIGEVRMFSTLIHIRMLGEHRASMRTKS